MNPNGEALSTDGADERRWGSVGICGRCPGFPPSPSGIPEAGNAINPGVTPSSALPRVWSGSAPQPRRGLCRRTETGAPTRFGVIMIPGDRFGTDTSSHQRNTIPFRPCFSHPRRAPNRSKPGPGNTSRAETLRKRIRALRVMHSLPWDPGKISREDVKARRRDRIRVLGVPASVRDKLRSVHMVFPSALSGGEGENREWTPMGAHGGTPLRTGVDRFPAPTDGMFPPRQRRRMR